LTRRVEAIILLAVFVAVLLVGLRVSWQVAPVESPGVPPELIAVGSRLRAIAWSQVVVGLLGIASAIGVFRGARWGYVGVAWLLTSVAVVAGLAKVVASPAMRIDPPWGLVGATAALAGLAWYRINAMPGDA
jgi:hypothetical protein